MKKILMVTSVIFLATSCQIFQKKLDVEYAFNTLYTQTYKKNCVSAVEDYNKKECVCLRKYSSYEQIVPKSFLEMNDTPENRAKVNFDIQNNLNVTCQIGS